MNYIFRRVLWIIPTLFLIAAASFYLSIQAPGDPVQMYMARHTETARMTPAERKQIQEKIISDLHLDLPGFYFQLKPLGVSDTSYRIRSKDERKHWNQMAFQTDNWPLINQIRTQILQLQEGANSTDLELSSALRFHWNIEESVRGIEAWHSENHKEEWNQIKDLYVQLSLEKNEHAMIPSMVWHGSNNRFHHWLSGLVRADFGISNRSGQEVSKLIWPKFKISFLLSFLSICLAYLLSIPLGLLMAKNRNGWLDRIGRLGSFLLYGLPSFFVASLLLLFFSNPHFLYWFPESGLMDPLVYNPNWSFAQKVSHQTPYFVLPILSFTYGMFAYILNLVRSESINEAQQPYVLTAYTKGLSSGKVYSKHILRNILLPLITIFTQAFPAALGGSVIIESIFQIPGLGYEIFEAILQRDYAVVVGVFTFSGLITILFYLLADVLYQIADPRIKLDKV